MARALLLACAVTAVAADSAVVTLSRTVVQPQPIRENFVGFSIEVDGALKQMTVNGALRQSYSNLMKVLRDCSHSAGPNIRVGGNSADESVYVPSGPLPSGDTYRITSADLQAYLLAIPTWNGTLTLDVNFRDPSSAALAVAHVKAAAAVMPWSLIEGIEVGNEVDLFSENGIRDKTYNYSQYESEFDLYQGALHSQAAVPYPRIQGAVYCCSHFDNELGAYTKKFASSGVLNSISYHHYPLSVCNKDPPVTIAELMADSAAQSKNFPSYISDVVPAGVPLYVGEGNSVSCGGQAGVSDAFAAALWSIDALFTFASYGVSRWNFHGCPNGPYCAIVYADITVDDPKVMPLFYGIWAFTTATANASVIHDATVKSNNPFIKAWHVIDKNSAERVVLLHKDPSKNAVPPTSADVTIIPSSPPKKSPASAVFLTPGADGLASHDGLTFGGLTFDNTSNGVPVGTWSPVVVPYDASVGGYKLTLTQGTAAILSLP